MPELFNRLPPNTLILIKKSTDTGIHSKSGDFVPENLVGYIIPIIGEGAPDEREFKRICLKKLKKRLHIHKYLFEHSKS